MQISVDFPRICPDETSWRFESVLTILHQCWNTISYYILLLFNAVVKPVNNNFQASVQILGIL